jgi:hypothetical protein
MTSVLLLACASAKWLGSLISASCCSFARILVGHSSRDSSDEDSSVMEPFAVEYTHAKDGRKCFGLLRANASDDECIGAVRGTIQV